MAREPATHYTTMIRDLPQADRPRERLRELGPRALLGTAPDDRYRRVALLASVFVVLMRTGTPGQSVLELSNHLLANMGGQAHVSFKSKGLGFPRSTA